MTGDTVLDFTDLYRRAQEALAKREPLHLSRDEFEALRGLHRLTSSYPIVVFGSPFVVDE